jgi:hypothetical protein
MVQGVSHGRWHRSPQDPVGEREEGAAVRTRASLSRRAHLLKDMRIHALRPGVLSSLFPPPHVEDGGPSFGGSFASHLLHLRQRHDAWRTQVFQRLIGVESQCYLGYIYLFFYPEGSHNGRRSCFGILCVRRCHCFARKTKTLYQYLLKATGGREFDGLRMLCYPQFLAWFRCSVYHR